MHLDARGLSTSPMSAAIPFRSSFLPFLELEPPIEPRLMGNMISSLSEHINPKADPDNKPILSTQTSKTYNRVTRTCLTSEVNEELALVYSRRFSARLCDRPLFPRRATSGPAVRYLDSTVEPRLSTRVGPSRILNPHFPSPSTAQIQTSSRGAFCSTLRYRGRARRNGYSFIPCVSPG